MASLIVRSKSTQLIILFILQLPFYGCATSLASDKDPQTATDSPSLNLQHMEVGRTIDWNEAASQAATDKAVLEKMHLQFRRQASAKSDGAQPVVPILLPRTTINTTAVADGVMSFSDPVILMSESGHTVILGNPKLDIVIDATDTMMQSINQEADDPPQHFDGEIQAIEGGGAEITIGRFGALYSIQFMCNAPTQDSCVDDMLIWDVIASLVVLPSTMIPPE